MNSAIYKIFHNGIDEQVHNEFVKFSKGVFQDRYLVDAKKQKDKWSIKTGPEFANFLVRRCLNNAGSEVSVKGVIVSAIDIRDKIKMNISGVKQFMGIKQYQVEGKVKKEDIIASMEAMPKVFYALSFTTDKDELKIKAKAPKSAKPAATGDKEPKAEFCSLKTSDESITKDLFFDCPSFNEINIKHIIEIKEIILPKGEKDPVKLRENAVRKGVVKRMLNIDGKREVKEKDFEA